MPITVTMLQTRLGEGGATWTAGQSYSASDAFGAYLISSNLATGPLPPPEFANLTAQQVAATQALASPPGLLWANRASAAANSNALQWFSDVGPAGTLMKSNGTNWCAINGSAVLYSSASPIIVLSSGTFANTTGSMTGLASLPVVPVGVVRVWVFAGAGIPASGLYFATFSSATACQLYTDAAGTITPTGITAGAYAGGTTEALIPIVTVQGGLMGLNGGLRISLRYSSALNNANAKTVAIKFGGTSVGVVPGLASGLSLRALSEIKNRGSASVQLISTGSAQHSLIGGTISGVAWQQGTIDTTSDRVLAVGFTHAAATDSTMIEECTVELIGG